MKFRRRRFGPTTTTASSDSLPPAGATEPARPGKQIIRKCRASRRRAGAPRESIAATIPTDVMKRAVVPAGWTLEEALRIVEDGTVARSSSMLRRYTIGS